MIKRFAMLAATAVLALGIGSAAVAQDGGRIVVVTHGQATDPFWSVVKNGADEAMRCRSSRQE
jgi:simple sugar transport system substrate-binding protein